jgi:leucyl-tRNA synthetase
MEDGQGDQEQKKRLTSQAQAKENSIVQECPGSTTNDTGDEQEQFKTEEALFDIDCPQTCNQGSDKEKFDEEFSDYRLDQWLKNDQAKQGQKQTAIATKDEGFNTGHIEFHILVS